MASAEIISDLFHNNSAPLKDHCITLEQEDYANSRLLIKFRLS